jgi:hypothetical protein
MRKLLNAAAAAVLGLSLFWACHMNEAVENRFDVVADSSWTSCDTVTAVLLGKDGTPLDTLFNAPLRSLDDLKGLPADKYDGSKASIHVFGSKAGALCFDETRSFEGDGGNVVIDTVKSLEARPASVSVAPESLVIPLGAAGVAVKASVKPAYVDQAVDWRLAGDGIVSLTLPAGGDGTQPRINPEKIGVTEVTVKSRKDSTKVFKLKVRVTAPAGIGVTVDKDSIIAYVGGDPVALAAQVKPDAADQKVDWSSLNPDVATIDSLGRVRGVKEGETYVQARSRANGVYFSTHVQVKRDAPRLAIDSKTGAPVNTNIAFSVQATQEYGTLVLYAWDLDGDGAWDDSTVDAWKGTKVDLPSRSAKYSKEGQVIARFRVRDSEGNETIAQVALDIGNQAPEFLSAPHDTLISIKDTVPFPVTVRDVDGKVAWIGWDYDGDGAFDDTTSPGADSVKAAFSHRYQDAGLFRALIKAKDETGKARIDTVVVRVDLDRPKADAGNDTTVTVNAKVNVHVGGSDKLGRIVTREVRLGGAFRALSGSDTVITAPAEPGVAILYVRVTDDDGLSDIDSAVVTVVLSANADLTDLAFSAGALDPAFKPGTSNYTAHVAYGDSIVTVTPTAKDAAAKITVNAKPVASGAASDPAKLAVGFTQNVFQILVTAADGTQHLYSVSVARDPSADASLSKLDVTGFSLKPAFSPTVVDYADTVPALSGPVTLKPTLAVATGSLTVNDSAMASGTATPPMPVALGENVFKIAVTSQSGLIKTVYTIKVVRRAQLFVFRSLDGKPAVQTDSTETVPGVPAPLSANPVTGYRFVKWTLLEGTALVQDSASNPTAITVKSAKAKVQAEFTVNNFIIKAGGTAGGTITPSGDVKVNFGSDTAFAVAALPGYRLKALSVDGADGLPALVNGKYAFKNVTADHAINALFVKVDTLTATSGAGGSVTPAKILIDDGGDTAFTVTGGASYSLVSLLDNGTEKKGSVGSNGRYPIHADGNHTVAATWIQGITMKGVAGAGGSITPDSVVVNAGTDLTYNITVNAGYRLEKLLDNGVDSTQYVVGGNQYKIAKIATGHTVTVNFRRQYAITSDVVGAGKVDIPSPKADSASSQDITIVPANNYRVSIALDNGNPIDNIDSFKGGVYALNGIVADHLIKIRFMRQYLVSTSVNDPDMGSISSSEYVDSNNIKIVSITPKPGYFVSGLTDNGVSVPATTSDTLKNITEDHAIVATFAAIPTYKFTMGDSLEAKGYAAGKVCYQIGKNPQVCDVAISISVPAGTDILLESASEVCSTGITGCKTTLPFVDWLYSPGKNAYKSLTPTNPDKPWIGQKITIDGTTIIRPRYSNAF